MAKKEKEDQYIKLKDMENLLAEQTDVILSAVDEKLARVDKRFTEMDKKLIRMEARINAKIEKLTITLDRFLKRVTDLEDEFTMMKHDVNRLKRIIEEKLGVTV